MSSIARSRQGWVSFFNALQDSNLNDLVWWSLDNNSIDDEALQLLVGLVSNMSSLKNLNLSATQSATPTGWQALTRYLRSPHFALKELDLGQNHINDDALIAFTSALAHNHTLEALNLFECTDEDGFFSITDSGWRAASYILCNKTSIKDTFNSNHTFHIFSGGDNNDELKSCSDLNRNRDKVEVARQKILQSHFSTEDDMATNIQEFLDMELEVMPTAIAWIGRPTPVKWRGTNVSGLSLMFNLTRKIPDLFDSNAHKKPLAAKRKRGL